MSCMRGVLRMRVRRGLGVVLALMVVMLATVQSGQADTWNTSKTGMIYPTATTTRLGIGTTAPSSAYKLQVQSTQLDIAAFTKITNTNSYATIRIDNPSSSGSTHSVQFASKAEATIGNSYAYISADATNVHLAVRRADGFVGIGTTNPGAPLHVFNAAPVGLIVENTAGAGSYNNQIAFKANGKYWWQMGTDVQNGGTTGNFELYSSSGTGGSRIVVMPGGNVGIGTTAPVNRLHVDGGGGTGAVFCVTRDENAAQANRGGQIYLNPPAYNATDGQGSVITTNYWGGNGALGNLTLNAYSRTNQLVVHQSGNVGIGTTAPTALLHLSGTQPSLAIQATGSALGNIAMTEYLTREDATGPYGRAAIAAGSEGAADRRGYLSFSTRPVSSGYTERMRITSVGNVGIGTTAPSAALEVAGATGIKCDKLTIKDWTIRTPDYVFESSYKLKDLKEVDNFVKTHKHLPDVPSATDMKKKGMDMAEMNLTLLKKVEELTLYVIKQQEEIEGLKAQVKTR